MNSHLLRKQGQNPAYRPSGILILGVIHGLLTNVNSLNHQNQLILFILIVFRKLALAALNSRNNPKPNQISPQWRPTLATWHPDHPV
jgi:hypothetical protein